MHSRKRRTTEPSSEEVQNEKLRLQKIQNLHSQIFEAKENEDLSESALELTSKAISLSPDIYSFFNYRRKILEHVLSQSPSSQLASILKDELTFLGRVIKENPKSYSAWYHRMWVLEKCKGEEAILNKELELCQYMLRQDQRNFHCWNYRTWLVKLTQLQSPNEELAFTQTMILRDFSNYSAWHYRTKVVRQLYPETLPLDFVKKELDMLKNAYFTCPSDQSIWNYHRWLLLQQEPIKITSISPREYTSAPAYFLVGFSHNVSRVGEESIGVSQGWEPLSGNWEPLETAPFSYIWKFTPSCEPQGPVELRLNPLNSTLCDINGQVRLASLKYKYIETEGTKKLEVHEEEEVELLEMELNNLEELLGIEDTPKDRIQPLLRKAQILETVHFMKPGATKLQGIVECYKELLRISPSDAFYEECLRTFQTLKTQVPPQKEVLSRKMKAKLLGII